MLKLVTDKSILRCCSCNREFNYKKKYLIESKYPNDYLIECRNPNCDNWEEVGNNIPGSFVIIEQIEVVGEAPRS